MNTRSFLLAGMLAIVTWAKPAYAASNYDGCTGFITSLPAVVSASGTWCLKQNLSTAVISGNAITIDADNVTIDCNDFVLDDSTAGLTTDAIGIYTYGRSHTTVRNCSINGFGWGVVLLNGTQYLVENNRLFGITFVGMSVGGDDSIIRRNRVVKTGRSTVYIDAHGINAIGSMDVYDNTVAGVATVQGGGGMAFGIWVEDIDSSNKHGSYIVENRVRGLSPDGSGQAIAIRAGGTRSVLRNNVVVADSGGTTGLGCGAAFIRAKANVINGFPFAMSNCGDAGGNDVSP